MAEPLAPGATIGILGGGQLGRMLSLAAARLGLKTHIFEPGAAPAADVAAAWTQAAYDDRQALSAFADAVDVVTYEFENIPESALDILEARLPVRPNRRALSVSQDRLTEKDFLAELGLDVAPYANVESRDDLARAVGRIGTPSILKTRRFGYDGKGQVRLTSADAVDAAWVSMQDAPCVLEGMVAFEREISVIAARGLSGPIVAFDPGENLHRDGILHTSRVPARIPGAMASDAVLMASRILTALDYVGVMGIEMFVTRDGLLINEIAPRVHNSGHWTQNGCVVDQFEQHIRAVAGWPLGDPTRHCDVVMENLIGDAVENWADTTDAALHLYGKAEARPGRKMGHVNRVRRRA